MAAYGDLVKHHLPPTTTTGGKGYYYAYPLNDIDPASLSVLFDWILAQLAAS
jgi:hypothetical protein